MVTKTEQAILDREQRTRDKRPARSAAAVKVKPAPKKKTAK